ncbi:hypothetical protein GCM10027592_63330 [Spirosoma flavus]
MNGKDPDTFSRSAVDKLSVREKIELLKVTKSLVVIDHLEHSTQYNLPTLPELQNVLFTMARQAAALKASRLLANEIDPDLSESQVSRMSFERLLEVFARTANAHNVELIQTRTADLIHSSKFKKLLYGAAKVIVGNRQKAAVNF